MLHLQNPDQRLVHDLLAGADFGWRDLTVRAVAPFRSGFDRREVLMIAVAVTEEEQAADSGSFPQSDRMLTWKDRRRLPA